MVLLSPLAVDRVNRAHVDPLCDTSELSDWRTYPYYFSLKKDAIREDNGVRSAYTASNWLESRFLGRHNAYKVAVFTNLN